MQYVADRRIANAKKMLERGEEVTAAAAANGFDDYSYFCKVFKKKKNGTLTYKKSGGNHQTSKDSAKQIRQRRNKGVLSKGEASRIKSVI